MSEEPRPLDPEVRYHVCRAAVLKDHADAVAELQARAVRAWDEVLGREVRFTLMDGFSPRAAEQAARNNLALRRAEFDEEVAAELWRLRSEVLRKLRRLEEDLEDGVV